MDKKRLKKYAELTVKVGANVKKAKGVIINASVDQEEFVALITEEAYRVRSEMGRSSMEQSKRDPFAPELSNIGTAFQNAPLARGKA